MATSGVHRNFLRKGRQVFQKQVKNAFLEKFSGWLAKKMYVVKLYQRENLWKILQLELKIERGAVAPRDTLLLATKPTKHKQTNNKPTIFLKRNISRLKKKTGPGQIRPQNLCRPRRIRNLQSNCSWDDWKFEFIMSLDTKWFCWASC